MESVTHSVDVMTQGLAKARQDEALMAQQTETLLTRVSWLERGRLGDQQRIKQIQDDATTLMKQIAIHVDTETSNHPGVAYNGHR